MIAVIVSSKAGHQSHVAVWIFGGETCEARLNSARLTCCDFLDRKSHNNQLWLLKEPSLVQSILEVVLQLEKRSGKVNYSE